MKFIALFLALGYMCNAHICSLDPPQRGGFNVSLPGDSSCWRRTGPCGNIPRGAPTASYTAGQTITVVLQQNLNHFYPGNPGFLDVAVALTPDPSSDDEFTVLGAINDWPAFEQVWQANFSIQVTLPPTSAPNGAVLRVRYVSNNPDEVYPANNTQAVFWNCADVSISSASSSGSSSVSSGKTRDESVRRAGDAASQHDGPAPPCYTPGVWSAMSIEQDAAGSQISRTYAYDTIAQFVYVRREGPGVSTLPNVLSISTWTNYSDNLNEWVLWEYTDRAPECELYGADAFYAWAYGEMYGQIFLEHVTVAGAHCHLWGAGPFELVSDAALCLPVYRYNQFGSIEAYFNVTPSVDYRMFDVPLLCRQATLRGKRSFCSHGDRWIMN